MWNEGLEHQSIGRRKTWPYRDWSRRQEKRRAPCGIQEEKRVLFEYELVDCILLSPWRKLEVFWRNPREAEAPEILWIVAKRERHYFIILVSILSLFLDWFVLHKYELQIYSIWWLSSPSYYFYNDPPLEKSEVKVNLNKFLIECIECTILSKWLG